MSDKKPLQALSLAWLMTSAHVKSYTSAKMLKKTRYYRYICTLYLISNDIRVARLTQYFPFDVYAHDKKKIFRGRVTHLNIPLYMRDGDHATITYRDIMGIYLQRALYAEPYHLQDIDNIVHSNGFSTIR